MKHLAALVLAALVAANPLERPLPHHRFVKRQTAALSSVIIGPLVPSSPQTTANTPVDTVPTSQDAPAPATTQDTGIIDSVTQGIASVLDPSTSAAPVVVTPSTTDSPSTTDALTTSLSSALESSTPLTTTETTRSARSTESQSLLPSISESSAPLPSITAESQETESHSSGVAKKTLIAIIAIAASIGGAVLIWTIIRKWKFSPSRKFNAKLAPIDFTADGRGTSIDGAFAAANEPKYSTEPKYGAASQSPDNKSWESFPQHSEYGSEYGRNSPPQDYYQHNDPFAGQRLPPPGANIDFNNRYH